MTTTSQILYDGGQTVVMQFTGDGSETDEPKVIVADLQPPALVKIDKITYDVRGGAIKLAWGDATESVDFLILSGQGAFDYSRHGGLTTRADDPTGNIMLTTVGFGVDSSYSILLEMQK